MILEFLKGLFNRKRPEKQPFLIQWSNFLQNNVTFYSALNDVEKCTFEQRCLLFLETTTIESSHLDVTFEDKLLVAASAIIPVWSFPNWHYFNYP